MTDLKHKYKEREPKDTVALLKSFFESKGYEIFEMAFETEAGTWTAHLEIFDKGLYILQSNGKGMNKEYCLASGYAELYERYCNMHPLITNLTFSNRLMMKNFEQKGYYFKKDEEEMSLSDVQENTPEIYDFLYRILKTDTGIHRYIKTKFEKLIGIPFSSTDFSDTNKVYLDPRLAAVTWTSMGLSAGNTLNECLAQAMSELTERIGTAGFFFEDIPIYYALDLEQLENEEIKNTIKKIQSKGYKFYVFDLSYNFQVPTLMSLLIDPNNLLTHINFGSFPVFDIAIERVITEIYQGIASYKKENCKTQRPYRGITSVRLLNGALNNISEMSCIDESFFNKIKIVSTYNHDIFIEQHQNNEEIVDCLNQIFKKLGLKCYYSDNSLIPDMYAIRLICPGLKLMEEKTCSFEKLSPLLVDKGLKILEQEKELINNVLSITGNTSKEEINKIYQKINNLVDYSITVPQPLANMIANLCFSDFCTIFNSSEEKILSTLVQWGHSDISLKAYQNTYWLQPLKKYLTIFKYKNIKKYSVAEIKNIVNYLGMNVSVEDIEKVDDVDYIIMQIFILTTVQLYNSEFYSNLINKFIQ